jgi:hypothetical protein
MYPMDTACKPAHNKTLTVQTGDLPTPSSLLYKTILDGLNTCPNIEKPPQLVVVINGTGKCIQFVMEVLDNITKQYSIEIIYQPMQSFNPQKLPSSKKLVPENCIILTTKLVNIITHTNIPNIVINPENGHLVSTNFIIHEADITLEHSFSQVTFFSSGSTGTPKPLTFLSNELNYQPPGSPHRSHSPWSFIFEYMSQHLTGQGIFFSGATFTSAFPWGADPSMWTLQWYKSYQAIHPESPPASFNQLLLEEIKNPQVIADMICRWALDQKNARDKKEPPPMHHLCLWPKKTSQVNKLIKDLADKNTDIKAALQQFVFILFSTGAKHHEAIWELCPYTVVVDGFGPSEAIYGFWVKAIISPHIAESVLGCNNQHPAFPYLTLPGYFTEAQASAAIRSITWPPKSANINQQFILAIAKHLKLPHRSDLTFSPTESGHQFSINNPRLMGAELTSSQRLNEATQDTFTHSPESTYGPTLQFEKRHISIRNAVGDTIDLGSIKKSLNSMPNLNHDNIWIFPTSDTSFVILIANTSLIPYRLVADMNTYVPALRSCRYNAFSVPTPPDDLGEGHTGKAISPTEHFRIILENSGYPDRLPKDWHHFKPTNCYRKMVIEALTKILNTDELLHGDSTLAQLGIDSIGITRFLAKLKEQFLASISPNMPSAKAKTDIKTRAEEQFNMANLFATAIAMSLTEIADYLEQISRKIYSHEPSPDSSVLPICHGATTGGGAAMAASIPKPKDLPASAGEGGGASMASSPPTSSSTELPAQDVFAPLTIVEQLVWNTLTNGTQRDPAPDLPLGKLDFEEAQLKTFKTKFLDNFCAQFGISQKKQTTAYKRLYKEATYLNIDEISQLNISDIANHFLYQQLKNIGTPDPLILNVHGMTNEALNIIITPHTECTPSSLGHDEATPVYIAMPDIIGSNWSTDVASEIAKQFEPNSHYFYSVHLPKLFPTNADHMLELLGNTFQSIKSKLPKENTYEFRILGFSSGGPLAIMLALYFHLNKEESARTVYLIDSISPSAIWDQDHETGYANFNILFKILLDVFPTQTTSPAAKTSASQSAGSRIAKVDSHDPWHTIFYDAATQLPNKYQQQILNMWLLQKSIIEKKALQLLAKAQELQQDEDSCFAYAATPVVDIGTDQPKYTIIDAIKAKDPDTCRSSTWGELPCKTTTIPGLGHIMVPLHPAVQAELTSPTACQIPPRKLESPPPSSTTLSGPRTLAGVALAPNAAQQFTHERAHAPSMFSHPRNEGNSGMASPPIQADNDRNMVSPLIPVA